MEFLLMGTLGAGWVGFTYWRMAEHRKRQREDRAYWDKIRHECPSCRIRRVQSIERMQITR